MYLIKREMSAGSGVETVEVSAPLDVTDERQAAGGLAGWVLRSIREWGVKGMEAARHAPRRQLAVEESLSLGGNRRLTLVRCAGERFLIGAGNDGVQTIVRVHERRAEQSSAGAFTCR